MPESAVTPYEITDLETLVAATRSVLDDYDTGLQDIDIKVLYGALAIALPEFSRYVPLRQLTDPVIELTANAKTAALPANFLAFDLDSFRDSLQAICGDPSSVYADSLIFSSLTQAARPRDSQIMVAPQRKRFDIIHNAVGAKVLYVNPPLTRSSFIDCIYYGVHGVTAEAFTIPVEYRSGLVYKIAQMACLSQKRRLWMDQQARLSFTTLADAFKEMYEDMVVNIPVGFFG